MIDVRQGRLTLGADPFSRVADRSASGMVEPMSPSRGPFLTADDPKLIAQRGFDWRSSTIGQPFYYRDGDGIWRDTFDDTPRAKP